MELKEGQVYKPIEGDNIEFTSGESYPVRINEYGIPFILSDSVIRWYNREIIGECFELVQDNKEEKK